ncbi:MAG: type II toxin-antitoxin system RelE/ParE family toxin [Candidatus Thermoplasmatota archaeon]|nr:type II toxin-antitoxin system RelE/ParE family toxin [Candidatus Thermoplasmatota archaeon]
MPFQVEFSRLAADKFEKLAGDTQERLAKKLQQVAERPRRYLSRLRGVDAFKIRVGDYRVIVDVDWESKTIYILTVGHRRTIYRD